MAVKPLTGELKGITIETHYPNTDPECISDYYDIVINIRGKGWDGRMEYGDYYHDRGSDKAEGFIDAMKLVYGDKFPVLRIDLADREDLG